MIAFRHTTVALLALATLAACGGDTSEDEAEEAPSAQVTPEEYAKRQQAFADSIIKSAKAPEKLVEELGKGYAVANAALTDSLKSRLVASDCFKKGQEIDPYLGGSVSFMLHMSIVGVDAAYVQDSKWSSPAGNVVNSCLNAQAKGWKIGRTGPINTANIVQHEFPSTPPRLPSTDSAAKGTRGS